MPHSAEGRNPGPITQPSERQPPGVNITWPGKSVRARAIDRAICPGHPEILETVGNFDGVSGRLIYGDLRTVLPTIARESVDFAYLDPPFMTQRNFSFSDVALARCRLRLVGADEAGSQSNSTPRGYRDQWAATEYVEFLDTTIRLIRPLLKPSGLIAVHTDFRAAHYVRMLLDEHFGPDRIVNELIWKYGLGNARSTRHFLRKHDNIAVYAAGSMENYYFRMLRGTVTPAQRAKYCHEDKHGRYMLSYGRKYYLKGGKPLESVLDIPTLGATDGERTGYPTQKPMRLLKVLIEAFCPPGGVVLDPCCGAGTTAAAAQELGCRWIANDANDDAVRVARARLAETIERGKPGFRVERAMEPADLGQVGS